ncbi:MAG: LON peptidase substrate-binding domain-containing protein, partial [Gemmatimonadota bacterium]
MSDREGIQAVHRNRHQLPVLPLRETVVFPGVTAPIVAGRDKTLRAIEHALGAESEAKKIFAVAQRENVDEPTTDVLYNVGVICRIAQVQRFPGGLQLLLEGEKRATTLHYSETEDGHMEAIVTPLADQGPLNPEDAAFQGLFREVSEKAAELGRHRGVPEEIIERFPEKNSLSHPLSFSQFGQLLKLCARVVAGLGNHLFLPRETGLMSSRSLRSINGL